MHHNRLYPVAISALALSVIMLVSLGLGKYPLPLSDMLAYFSHAMFGGGILDSERLATLHNLLVEIRMPRILAAAMIGAALSVSGAAYQAMFVNPLVSPGILGVLGGAAFGAVLGMLLGTSWFGVQALTFVFGFVAMGVAVGVARIYRINTSVMLVLGGVISSAFFTSLVSIVKYTADPYNQLPAIVYWLMGNMSLVDRATAVRAGIPICIGIAGLIMSGRRLNALSMGDEEAQALGINVNRVRMVVIVCATLVSAMTVVIAGTIGWVGLIIPHIARMITGPDNETLLPASALLGAAYLVIVDDISRLAFSFEIPIGILTALVGIPFFALVLKSSRKGWC
jgi:iron complex transport system permease protein